MSKGAVADVTVVISTFNRAQYLPEAIESILGQTVRPVRIVVVDDGSTDNTEAVMRPYLRSVEYVKRANGGKASALAMIMPTIATEFTWFFDDDDAAYSDALERLVETVKRDDSFGFAFGSYDVTTTAARLIDAPKRHVAYALDCLPLQRQRLQMYRECTVMMSGALLRTDAIRKVGGVRVEQLRAQDYDLMIRLAAVFPFAYCGASVYIWRQHEGIRGAGMAKHSNADRIAAWAKYNEPIGRFLRYGLPITAYFREGTETVYSSLAIREALISRAWAIAPKLPLECAIADIIEAIRTESRSALTTDEISQLQDALGADFVSFRRVRTLWALWRLGATAVGCRALAELAKGVYWRARVEDGLFNRLRWKFAAIAIHAYALSCRAFVGRA